jgi:signal transduction histidine kinase
VDDEPVSGSGERETLPELLPEAPLEPLDIPRFKQIMDLLRAEIAERERVTAALARKNAELSVELQRRLAESESFNHVLVSLLQKTVLDQVLDIVCAEAQGLLGATGSAVLLLTDQAWLEVKHRLGKPMAAVEPVPVDGSLAGQVVRQGEPVLVNDPALLAQAQVYQWPSDLTALLTVPLHVKGGVIGVLDVVNKSGGFTEADVPVLSVFANQAAMVIEHARLQEQAEQLAVLGERQRLARELHDSVTQSLFSVSLYADAATRALVAGKQDTAADYLRELREIANEGMRDMRLLIFQLHPPVLETEGLVTALQARLAAVEGRAGLQTELRVEGERRLPIAIESELYWIAQEALNNVRKHAAAQNVVVRLRYTDSTITLEVLDDGVGFDPQAVPPEARGGMRTMAERTASIGGKLTYGSTPSDGTQLKVEVTL